MVYKQVLKIYDFSKGKDFLLSKAKKKVSICGAFSAIFESSTTTDMLKDVSINDKIQIKQITLKQLIFKNKLTRSAIRI